MFRLSNGSQIIANSFENYQVAHGSRTQNNGKGNLEICIDQAIEGLNIKESFKPQHKSILEPTRGGYMLYADSPKEGVVIGLGSKEETKKASISHLGELKEFAGLLKIQSVWCKVRGWCCSQIMRVYFKESLGRP